jgi:hypothetical protein
MALGKAELALLPAGRERRQISICRPLYHCTVQYFTSPPCSQASHVSFRLHKHGNPIERSNATHTAHITTRFIVDCSRRRANRKCPYPTSHATTQGKEPQRDNYSCTPRTRQDATTNCLAPCRPLCFVRLPARRQRHWLVGIRVVAAGQPTHPLYVSLSLSLCQTLQIHKICGVHGGAYEECRLLGCYGGRLS